MATKNSIARIRDHFNKSNSSSGGSGGGFKKEMFYKIPEPRGGGETKVSIRVLPPWKGAPKTEEGDRLFYMYMPEHHNFSIGGRPRHIRCPEKEGRGPCPICKFVAKLKSSGDEDIAKRLLNSWRNRIDAQDHHYVNILVRGEEDKGIRIFNTNWKFIRTVLEAEDDENPIDIKNGLDIVATRTGTGNKTRYSYRLRRKPTSVSFNKEDLHPLHKLLPEMDYNQIMQILVANFGEEMREIGMKVKGLPGEEDTDEAPRKKKKSKKPVKKSKKVVEEEDEDIDDDEEIDEDVDEEEDVDDEDEEEDTDDTDDDEDD